MSYSIGISHLTATSCMVYIDDDGAAGGPQNLTFYESDGTTVVKSISASDPGWNMSEITVDGLTPNTTYVTKLDDDPTVTATFTTLTDEPRTATESQWQDLANRVKAKSDVQITMTNTDPGEGSALAENNYVAVYGGDPIIMDYSTTEIKTGAKWIDGSAIYKKTFSFTTNSSATHTQVIHNISNLGTVIKYEGSLQGQGDYGQQVIPRVVPDDSAYGIGVGDITATKFVLIIGSSVTKGTQAYVTLYYTKSS